jgi:hypothetical protein
MTDQATDAGSRLLDRVRKLLAKAEDDSCTPPEAQALTAKAAELMAKYGIDRAMLAAAKPQNEVPSNRKILLDDPYATAKAHMLYGIACAMRCTGVQIRTAEGIALHLFGFRSDLERVEILYTSLLLQMASQFRRAHPATAYEQRHIKAWRRSWILGFAGSVVSRVKAAEQAAKTEAEAANTERQGPSVEIVLRDRSLAVRDALRAEYPHIRTSRSSCSGGGYRDGYAAGQRANVGGTSVRGGGQRALT